MCLMEWKLLEQLAIHRNFLRDSCNSTGTTRERNALSKSINERQQTKMNGRGAQTLTTHRPNEQKPWSHWLSGQIPDDDRLVSGYVIRLIKEQCTSACVGQQHITYHKKKKEQCCSLLRCPREHANMTSASPCPIAASLGIRISIHHWQSKLH